MTRADHDRIINARALEVLTAQSPGQREGAEDRLIDAIVTGYGVDNFELRRHIDRVLERANPSRYRRI
jgi:hypothetical protein